MSTFDGIVSEFPEIRVDSFRRSPSQPPPLACFLSHVHSDHLAGLESLRSPFIYCSAATREILIRLERYPCRINFAKGILESRILTYKHLRTLLKPIPLDTPTKIELRPGHFIQVTLLDAKHCPGSVMFLIEGDGKAVLYTGDTRSEPWFVNALARNPVILEYTTGIKTLDRIYLDTSFIEDFPFQTKAEGIAELLRKVARYPPQTIFHFQAWTYGYEDVWIALAKALNTRIHVDAYKMRIYNSLTKKDPNNRFSATVHLCPEAAALTGYLCGNTEQPGCLTGDTDVRLHSCEKGNYCHVVKNGPVVWIQPIIAHLEGGVDQLEIGVGGGGGDLEREVELDFPAAEEIEALLKLMCASDDFSKAAAAQIRDYLAQQGPMGHGISLDMDISSLNNDLQSDMKTVLNAIARRTLLRFNKEWSKSLSFPETLPGTVRFPYSRHSSYPELCNLVGLFKPKDVWPCTVQDHEWREQGISIKSLFGRHCSGAVFKHDLKLEAKAADRADSQQRSQEQTAGVGLPWTGLTSSTDRWTSPARVIQSSHDRAIEANLGIPQVEDSGFLIFDLDGLESRDDSDNEPPATSQLSQLSGDVSLERADAYAAMIRNLRGEEWKVLGLLSTSDHHTVLELDVADEIDRRVSNTNPRLAIKRKNETPHEETKHLRRLR